MNTEDKHHKKKAVDPKINHASEKEAKVDAPKEEMVEIPKAELDELREQATPDSEYRDQTLRTMAEMENLRKRLEKERKEYITFANRGMIGDILPVLDNFDRALKSVEHTKESAPYLQGVEMIYKQLEDVLKQQGLEEINALGESFDPHIHEAVQTEETDKCPEDTILEVILKGYLFRGNLLRPAAVKVSREKTPGEGEQHKM
ncbi:MAG: nucleotide exchange factor GrpE [Candidatus Auribacterota bacterium]|nr:nucleotide exchange factor GrpE [Candidatus Auribacterota bacterium]